MDRDTLVLGVAAVFAGVTVLMTVLAFTQSLFLLLVAAPFGLATYLMWQDVSGRTVVGRRAQASPRGRTDPGGSPGGGRSRFAREARERVRRERAGSTRGPGDRPSRGASTMPKPEAYRVLGLDPGADEDRVKSAYRRRAKELHPDSGGDEEEFKRLNRAYESLTR